MSSLSSSLFFPLSLLASELSHTLSSSLSFSLDSYIILHSTYIKSSLSLPHLSLSLTLIFSPSQVLIMKEKHEAFDLHAINVEKDTKKCNSHHWQCKYCGKQYTSGATRLLQHLSKTGGQVAACKMIPQNIADEIRASMRQGASSRSASNPPLFYEEASTHASSMGGSGSSEASMSGSASSKR